MKGLPTFNWTHPSYSTFFDPKRRASLDASGVNSAEALDAAIAADNGMIQDIKRQPETTIGIHFCRGNKRSAWGAEGSYEPIAEKAFGSLQMDRFLMEFDTERAGGFEPLRFVPKGKTVVLGLITTKEPKLEPEDELLRRIDQASKYVPTENLALSTQCGFASAASGNLLSWDDMRRKLELVTKVAQQSLGMTESTDRSNGSNSSSKTIKTLKGLNESIKRTRRS